MAWSLTLPPGATWSITQVQDGGVILKFETPAPLPWCERPSQPQTLPLTSKQKKRKHPIPPYPLVQWWIVEISAPHLKIARSKVRDLLDDYRKAHESRWEDASTPSVLWERRRRQGLHRDSGARALHYGQWTRDQGHAVTLNPRIVFTFRMEGKSGTRLKLARPQGRRCISLCQAIRLIPVIFLFIAFGTFLFS